MTRLTAPEALMRIRAAWDAWASCEIDETEFAARIAEVLEAASEPPCAISVKADNDENPLLGERSSAQGRTMTTPPFQPVVELRTCPKEANLSE
jgi:hypothetical protein